jgi:hypothetical protein
MQTRRSNVRSYISAHAAARRLDIDPRTLIKLVDRKVITPDARAGDQMLFADDAIKKMRAVVEAAMRRERT